MQTVLLRKLSLLSGLLNRVNGDCLVTGNVRVFVLMICSREASLMLYSSRSLSAPSSPSSPSLLPPSTQYFSCRWWTSIPDARVNASSRLIRQNPSHLQRGRHHVVGLRVTFAPGELENKVVLLTRFRNHAPETVAKHGAGFPWWLAWSGRAGCNLNGLSSSRGYRVVGRRKTW